MLDGKEYQFYSLGESNLVVSWGNAINREWNDKVNDLSKTLHSQPFAGFIDAIPAYSSLTVMYDISKVYKNIQEGITSYEWVKEHITTLISDTPGNIAIDTYVIQIPVCYDETLGNDLAVIGNVMKLEKDEVIALHTGRLYHVYMPGFLPGFAYMGEVDSRIAIARKQTPVPVQPGAVGIAGLQTGIYPMRSPGGWHIVGYTPYTMFDATSADDPCLLHSGDTVQFTAICIDDYYAIQKKIIA